MTNRTGTWVLAGALCLLAPVASSQDSAPPPAPAPATKPAPKPAPAAQPQPAGTAQPEAPPPAATVQEEMEVAPPPEAEPPPEGYRRPPPRRGPPPPGAYPPPYYAPPPGYGYGPYPGEMPPPPPPMRRNNPGMMAAGIVLTCVGAVGAIVGVSLISSAQEHIDYDQCSGNLCPASAIQPEDEEMRNAGIVVALSGVAFIAVGIPLIAVGARKVPLEGPPQASLQFKAGPGGGAVKLSF